MATGPISFVGGVGGIGPQRIGSGKSIPREITRYFRRNLGTIDYATHSTVTVDRIVMDVVPVVDNTGLPTGAPAVTAGLYQTIDFVYSGTISEIYRNGSNYFQGIIANVKYYFNGSLIHSWSIGDNGNTFIDSVGGNNATMVNPLASDWGLFTEQNNGDWEAENIWTFGDSIADGTEASFEAIVNAGSVLVNGATYRTRCTSSGFTSGNQQFRYFTEAGALISTNGPFTEDVTSNGQLFVVRAGNTPPNAGATLSGISVREVLKIA